MSDSIKTDKQYAIINSKTNEENQYEELDAANSGSTNPSDENAYELSITLVERRKRLHELASEINKWEDESNKKYNDFKIKQKNLNYTINISNSLNKIKSLNQELPVPPVLPNEFFNKSSNYCSPKQCHYQTSPFNSANKENKSPSVMNSSGKQPLQQTKNSSSNSLNSMQFSTPSNEIMNVAQRILSKKQSSSATNTQVSSAKSDTSNSDNSSSLVKNMKSRFENMMSNSSNQRHDEDQSNVGKVPMTPRLIIKKFEEMSHGGATVVASQPLSAPTVSNTTKKLEENKCSQSSMIPQHSTTKQSSATNLGIDHKTVTPISSIKLNPVKNITNEKPVNSNIDESIINTDHIPPKSIIQKFEFLAKNNTGPKSSTLSSSSENLRKLSTLSDSGQNKQDNYNSTSLTYVSSMVSSMVSSTSPTCDEKLRELSLDSQMDDTTKFGDTNYLEFTSTRLGIISCNRHADEEAIYEEVCLDNDNDRDATSLFEDTCSQTANCDTDQISSEESTHRNANTNDGYSISGSSYTGSFMNREDFDEEQTNTDDYTEDDNVYEDSEDADGEDEPDEDDIIYDEDETYDNTSQDCKIDDETTVLSSNEDSSVIEPEKLKPSNSRSRLMTQNARNLDSATSSLASIDTNSQTSCDITSEPLFSIKEYRKQKRTINNGGRRSSIMPRTTYNNNLNVSKDPSAKVNKTNIKTNNLINNLSSSIDEQAKKIKYLERTKELEELIKQEDNIIHQTGIALERCLTDSQFTGSSEHIECSRILLISCQKRQAFLTEINRLKQLITNLSLNKKTNSTSSSSSASSSSSDVVTARENTNYLDEYLSLGCSDSSESNSGILPADLTGLLIFSDIQLPIKESYINKLKSGEEKRLFYFLCLIRNGIQVLQTQVISVQELIPTKETYITFPNRMAINNVDINFKVKIDVYILEVLPKDPKSVKQTLSSNTTSKFFSPFKSNCNNLFSHHGSHSNSGKHHHNHNYESNSNHHYNEQNTLGISNGGAKSSNFIHIDTIEITNKDISNNRFKLNISSSSVPLTGVLFVNVRCMPSKSIELKGFMTLFEDVNGLGSWDRRWCFLNNFNISYWKYPEDEYRNGPLGLINLTKCVTDRVYILPRDICARKYTIELLICDSDSSNNNEESAKSQQDYYSTNSKETTKDKSSKYKRYRLSADTKEQASDWVTNINYALANLRLWNPKAIRPINNKK